jgi:hypothetical protein
MMMEHFRIKSGYRQCFLHDLLAQQTKRLAGLVDESFEGGQPLVRLWLPEACLLLLNMCTAKISTNVGI